MCNPIAVPTYYDIMCVVFHFFQLLPFFERFNAHWVAMEELLQTLIDLPFAIMGLLTVFNFEKGGVVL